MAKKVKTTPTQVEANVGEILSKSERFIEAYKNHIMIGVGAIVLAVVAVLGIRQYYLLPKEAEAQEAVFPCEDYLANREWDSALNGDSVSCIGFLGVIDEYGFTKTGKLAKAYAGICYYHLGQYDEALEYLKSYSVDDKIISPVVAGLIGDCYVNTDNVEKGVKYFRKAASKAGSQYISPVYLKKAGLAYESLSDFKNAVKVYNTIKEQYAGSVEAADIDRYIIRASAQIK
ncbi:MAG: tetratricopeptide repeat protein [Dysgonamonadaceae bacterium]|jgi:tetratricopeptide (TPR) repeat protein|nr:tetratricopeptide repeat protein [Dysgonamonadaceae bacterium]